MHMEESIRGTQRDSSGVCSEKKDNLNTGENKWERGEGWEVMKKR